MQIWFLEDKVVTVPKRDANLRQSNDSATEIEAIGAAGGVEESFSLSGSGFTGFL
jgi:hypothetical protein